ncbi:MAG: Hpt domain-containing protein [Acidobacteriia bacterium]|nr:Hpt domain-containing protein [Terriglobia bacterium]
MTAVTRQRNEEKVRAALDRVWLSSRPEALSRLATLEGFLETLRSGRTNEKCLASALSAAHKLSGSLGMFGLDEASSCAAEVEALLCHESGPDIAEMAGLLRRMRNLMEATHVSARTPE